MGAVRRTNLWPGDGAEIARAQASDAAPDNADRVVGVAMEQDQQRVGVVNGGGGGLYAGLVVRGLVSTITMAG